MSQGVAIEVFTSMSVVERTWRAFEAASAHYVFQTFEWQNHYLATIGRADAETPVIVVVSDASGQPIMLWPLAFRRVGPVRLLIALGGAVTDYHAPLLAHQASPLLSVALIERVFEAVREQAGRFDAILIDKIPERIEMQRNPLAGLPALAPLGKNAHAARLGRDFEAWVKERRSSSVLKDERRSLRRLQELGTLVSRIDAGAGEADAIAAALFEQKSRRWRETGQRDRLAQPGWKEFYLGLIRKEVCRDAAHVSALQVGSEFVACHLGLNYRNRFYYLIPTFKNGEIEKYSPGRILMLMLMRWCAARDIYVFDFTVGDEEYKKKWCDDELVLFRYMRGFSALGNLYLDLLRCRQQAQKSELLRAAVRTLRGGVAMARGRRAA